MAESKRSQPGDWQRLEIEEHLADGVTLKERALRELTKALRTGRLIAFTGSFATSERGYPGWGKLLRIGLEEFTRAPRGRKAALIKELSGALGDSGDAPLIAHELLSELAGSPGDRDYDRKLVEGYGIASGNLHRGLGSSTMDKLVRLLGIRRIITTNYDFEAEFALLPQSTERTKELKDLNPWSYFSKKWHKPEIDSYSDELRRPDSSERRVKYTHDGTLLVSDIFSRERTDRLFEFALGASSVEGHVMHIHGRIDRPDSLVISYADYERLYRRSSLTKLPFEHAMRCLYAGNPILFIGLGLSEEEMLFHLRQFVSDGNPRHLAPRFVLWSPKGRKRNRLARDQRNLRRHGDVGKWDREQDEVSAEDEFQRIRWFRKYGIYTIFDTELSRFEATADRPLSGRTPPDPRLNRSISSLAYSIGERLAPFSWDRGHFRTMDQFLAPTGKTDASGIPVEGAVIWRARDNYRPSFPNWELAHRTDDPRERDPKEALDPSEYMRSIIERGAPIKAWLDVPGSGHGYLVQLIRKLVTERQARFDKSLGLAPTILAQINAGFSWEIDTTFELISGLYNGRTAFGDGVSRSRAMRRYAVELEQDLLSTGLPRRNMIIVLNGADRFFDSNGYPLSADLDNLLRIIPIMQQKVPQSLPGLVNPLSVFIFGTGRVARYLDRMTSHDAGLVDYYGSLQPPFHGERRQRRVERERPSPDLTIRDWPEADRFKDPTLLGLLDQAAREGDLDGPLANLPIVLPGNPLITRNIGTVRPSGTMEFRSAYLRATEKRLRTKIAANWPEWTLPGHDLFQLNRNRGRGPRHQRIAFFDAYCNIDALAKALGPATTKQHELETQASQAKLAMAIMRTMAFVGQPVEVTTIMCCPLVHELRELSGLAKREDFEGFLELLCELNLIAQMADYPENVSSSRAGETGPRYGLHRAMLHEVRDRYTVPLSDARTYTSFNIPLFVAQPIDDSEPSADAYQRLDELIGAFIRSDRPSSPHQAKVHSNVFGMRLRAAAASLRSYFTTSAMLMHEPEPAPSERHSPHLSRHCRQLEDLIDAFERHARAAAEKNQLRAVFPDDLVWLHDQRGVALLAQGDLYQAQNALREARQINARFVESDDRIGTDRDGLHGQNWRRISINEVHVDIERGRVGDAEDKLRAIEQSIEELCHSVNWLDAVRNRILRMPDRPIGWADGQTPAIDLPDWVEMGSAFQSIINLYGVERNDQPRRVDPAFPADAILLTGLTCHYRAWCSYIGGRLRTAERFIGQAVWIMRNLAEQRAYAIALRMQAAILRAQRNPDEARKCLRLCLAAADAGRQMDISHYAWIEQAELDIDFPGQPDPSLPFGNSAEALKQLNTSLRYATLTEMHRVRLEARIVLAKLRKATGDYDGALEHATDALALAMRFGFALRKITLRTLIGEILILRGDPVSGNSMLDQALHEGDRIGYQRAVEQVHALQLRFSL